MNPGLLIFLLTGAMLAINVAGKVQSIQGYKFLVPFLPKLKISGGSLLFELVLRIVNNSAHSMRIDRGNAALFIGDILVADISGCWPEKYILIPKKGFVDLPLCGSTNLSHLGQHAVTLLAGESIMGRVTGSITGYGYQLPFAVDVPIKGI